jgi:hypothetical protein
LAGSLAGRSFSAIFALCSFAIFLDIMILLKTDILPAVTKLSE